MADEQTPTGDQEEANLPPPKRLLAGKYESDEELEKGYLNLVPEIQRVRAEKDAAEREAAAYREMLAQANRQPEAQPDLNDPNEIKTYIDRRIESGVESKLQTILGPVAKAQQAKGEVATRYKDFSEDEIQRSVLNDPVIAPIYQRALGTDPELAYELGYHVAKANRPGHKEVQPVIDNGKKRDATAPRGAPSVPEPAGLNEERYRELVDKYEQTGDPREFLQARLKGIKWWEELGRDDS